ncbi:MAG: hypothetical protein HY747_06775 [Elusimicrobia bacterium]|nr:hypothetical protein [Elusimicrobiota bacterium]
MGLMFPLIVVNVCYGALTLLGSLLLVIPGIWLSVKYSFSPILLVVEDQTAFGALGRSSDLVKDFWFGVFGRLFLLIIIVYLGGFLFSRIPFVGPVISGLIFPPLLAACQLAMVESLREIKTAPAPEAPAAQTPAV